MNHNRRSFFPDTRFRTYFIIHSLAFISMTFFLFYLLFVSQSVFLSSPFIFEGLKLVILLLWGGSLFYLTRLMVESRMTLFFKRVDQDIREYLGTEREAPPEIKFRTSGFSVWSPFHINHALKFYHAKKTKTPLPFAPEEVRESSLNPVLGERSLTGIPQGHLFSSSFLFYVSLALLLIGLVDWAVVQWILTFQVERPWLKVFFLFLNFWMVYLFSLVTGIYWFEKKFSLMLGRVDAYCRNLSRGFQERPIAFRKEDPFHFFAETLNLLGEKIKSFRD